MVKMLSTQNFLMCDMTSSRRPTKFEWSKDPYSINFQPLDRFWSVYVCLHPHKRNEDGMLILKRIRLCVMLKRVSSNIGNRQSDSPDVRKRQDYYSEKLKQNENGPAFLLVLGEICQDLHKLKLPVEYSGTIPVGQDPRKPPTAPHSRAYNGRTYYRLNVVRVYGRRRAIW